MPIPEDLRGRILFFINQHGPEHQELRIPVGSTKPKYLPMTVKQTVKSTVQEAGWQVWRFKHEKCDKSMGFTTFVIIRKPTAAPITRDN